MKISAISLFVLIFSQQVYCQYTEPLDLTSTQLPSLFDSVSTRNISINELTQFLEVTEKFMTTHNSQMQSNDKLDNELIDCNLFKPLNEYYVQYLPLVLEKNIEAVWINCIHSSYTETKPITLVTIADGLNCSYFNLTLDIEEMKVINPKN